MMGERALQSIRKASNARLPLFPPIPSFLDGRTKDFEQRNMVEWEEDPPIQPLQLRSTGQPFNFNPHINRSSSIYSRSTAESGSMQSFDFDLSPTVPATEEQHRDSYLKRDSHFQGAFQDVELAEKKEKKGKSGKKGKYDEMSEDSGEDEDDDDKDPEAFKNKYHMWAFLALMMITQIVTVRILAACDAMVWKKVSRANIRLLSIRKQTSEMPQSLYKKFRKDLVLMIRRNWDGSHRPMLARWVDLFSLLAELEIYTANATFLCFPGSGSPFGLSHAGSAKHQFNLIFAGHFKELVSLSYQQMLCL